LKNSVRLDKFLATAGYGSRKDIKKLIRGGSVKVNGKPAPDSSLHVMPGTDLVTVNGATATFREFVYLMLYKPAGCISATEDAREQTVMEFVPEGFRHYSLFPVGRLDKDTEGLLILTNDGRLAHQLLAPGKHVPKTYSVQLDGPVSDNHRDIFARGIILEDGYQTMPATLIDKSSDDINEAELTIYEGKFHQVKRMFKALGLSVLYLKRIRMGGLDLDLSLRPGDIRELNEEELKLLIHTYGAC